jgi:hypothetical protein
MILFHARLRRSPMRVDSETQPPLQPGFAEIVSEVADRNTLPHLIVNACQFAAARRPASSRYSKRS